MPDTFPTKMSVVTNQTKFEVSIQKKENGEPHSITLRPMFNFDDKLPEQILIQVADQLKSQTHRAIHRFNGWSTEKQDRLVKGYLQMNNIMNDKKAHTEDLALGDLSPGSTLEIFDRATRGYNSDLHVYQVEWMYYINPNSLRGGSGGNSKETPGLYFKTCKSIPNVSCAAYAVAFWMAHKNEELFPASFRTHISRASNMKRILDLAKEMQEKLGWDTWVTLEKTKEILTIYPDHRLVVIQPYLKSSIVSTWDGPDYEAYLDKKIIYLYYDHLNEHYCAVKAPTNFMRTMRNVAQYKWCHECASIFNAAERSFCECIDLPKQQGYKRKKPCSSCGELVFSEKMHRCDYQRCIVCKKYHKKGLEILEHRCPLNLDIDTIPKDFESGDKKAKQVWVYDIESCIVLIEGKDDLNFVLDENLHHSYDDEGLPRNFLAEKYLQVPNLVVYQNVFTGERKKTNSLSHFILDMLTINGGRNIALAHNASGYDSRLVFEELVKVVGEKTEIKPIMRGGKFMRIAVNKTIFQDTMLHLIGSLKSLANDYLKGHSVQLVKGFFPHLFNKVDNYDYVGPIPPKDAFDLSFTLGDDGDLKEFDDWYATWEGREDWNFKQELESYCENDVAVLSEIVKLYHYECMKTFKGIRPELAISPWHYPTGAGYVHKMFLYYNEYNEMGETEEENAYRAKTSWCVLQPEEYYFTRQALRGGRTEIRKFYHEGPVRDQDIQSEYPFCQVGKSLTVANEQIEILYPVGYPTIEIHDTDYYPCNLHYDKPHEICRCDLPIKMKYKSKKTIIKFIDEIPDIHTYIKNFFGFIMIDAIPPNNLYHPVLPTYDPKRNKCLFSLEPIKCQTFCSVELQVALRMGYKVTKIYRADRYESAPSKWRKMLIEMYKLKLYNSQKAEPNDQNIFNETPAEYQARQYEYYLENFGTKLDFSNWDKRPAAKKTGKILCNSGWGKHAETVDHQQVKIISDSMREVGEMFFQSLDEQHYKLERIQLMAPTQTLFKYSEKRKKLHPNLHKGYLPCAVMVPMYGRLMLYNELYHLGERVLMVDTDSVKYIDVPGAYEITKGDCLGQWEEESKDQTIEFVAIGLKSYGQKTRSGKDSFKTKGVCIKRVHKNILNFEIAKKILKEGFVASVSQMTFDYRIGFGISKRGYIKEVKFQPHILKGTYDPENFQLYPFGYNRRHQ